MTPPTGNSQRIEELITFVLKLTADPEIPLGSVGRTRVMKYLFIADLAYAERNSGESYTGAEWRFHSFGPWSAAVQDAIEPTMAKLGAARVAFKFEDAAENEQERWLWHAKSVQLPDVKPPVVTQLAIERAVKSCATTNELLNQVYVTYPMLRAAPGEVLRFRQASLPPPTEPTPALTAKQQKKRKEAIDGAKERIRKLRELRQPESHWVDVHPTYDEEFARVTAALEEDAGAPDEPFDAEASFEPSVWKSGVRGGEIP